MQSQDLPAGEVFRLAAYSDPHIFGVRMLPVDLADMRRNRRWSMIREHTDSLACNRSSIQYSKAAGLALTRQPPVLSHAICSAGSSITGFSIVFRFAKSVSGIMMRADKIGWDAVGLAETREVKPRFPKRNASCRSQAINITSKRRSGEKKANGAAGRDQPRAGSPRETYEEREGVIRGYEVKINSGKPESSDLPENGSKTEYQIRMNWNQKAI